MVTIPHNTKDFIRTESQTEHAKGSNYIQSNIEQVSDFQLTFRHSDQAYIPSRQEAVSIQSSSVAGRVERHSEQLTFIAFREERHSEQLAAAR